MKNASEAAGEILSLDFQLELPQNQRLKRKIKTVYQPSDRGSGTVVQRVGGVGYEHDCDHEGCDESLPIWARWRSEP